MSWLQESSNGIRVTSGFATATGCFYAILLTPLVLGATCELVLGSVPTSAWIVIGPLSLVATVRWLRVDFVLTREGLTIRNYWRTYDVPWAAIGEIRAVGEDLLALPRFTTFIGFWSRDGDRVWTPTASDRPGPDRERRRLIALLEELAKPHGVEVDIQIAPNGNWDDSRGASTPGT